MSNSHGQDIGQAHQEQAETEASPSTQGSDQAVAVETANGHTDHPRAKQEVQKETGNQEKATAVNDHVSAGPLTVSRKRFKSSLIRLVSLPKRQVSFSPLFEGGKAKKNEQDQERFKLSDIGYYFKNALLHKENKKTLDEFHEQITKPMINSGRLTTNLFPSFKSEDALDSNDFETNKNKAYTDAEGLHQYMEYISCNYDGERRGLALIVALLKVIEGTGDQDYLTRFTNAYEQSPKRFHSSSGQHQRSTEEVQKINKSAQSFMEGLDY